MTITLTDPNVDLFDTVARTSYSTAAWTPPADSLLVAYIVSRATSPVASPSSVTNGSITFTEKVFLDNGVTNGRLSLYVADSGASPANTQTNASYAVSQAGCAIIVFALSGVDLASGPAAAIIQAPTNTATGTSLSITLASPGHSENRPIAGFYHPTVETTTERANWTEIGDGSFDVPAVNLEAQWRSDAFETTASASWTTSAEALGIAAEVKAQVDEAFFGRETIMDFETRKTTVRSGR